MSGFVFLSDSIIWSSKRCISFALFLSVDHHSCSDTKKGFFSILCIKLCLCAVGHHFILKYMCSCLLKAIMSVKPQKFAEQLWQFAISETAALSFLISLLIMLLSVFVLTSFTEEISHVCLHLIYVENLRHKYLEMVC